MGDRPPTKSELIAEVQELRQQLQAAEATLRDREQGISHCRDSIQEMDSERHDLSAELTAQAEELEAFNEELTIQAEELRIQNEELQALNLRLEVQKEELERGAQELEAERALLRTVLEQMPAGVIIAAAPSGKILLINLQVAKILGRPVSPGDSLETYAHFKVIRPDGRLLPPGEYPLTQALTMGKTVTEEELEIIQKDGAHRTLRVSAAPIRDRLGRIIAAAATYHDITDRKAAQAEIRRLASFPQLNPSPVLEINAAGAFTFYNRAALHVLQSLGGTAGPEAFIPEDLEDILIAAREPGKRRFYREVRIDDTIFAEDISYAKPFEVIRIYARDITERKEAEDALVQAKKEWELTFDAVPDLIAIIDRNHRLVLVNRPMAAALGVEPRDLVGRPCHEIMHDTASPPAFCPHSRLLADGREHVAEVRVLGRDFLVSASPLADRRGNLMGSVHVARDITERKQAEAALKQAHDKLEQRIRERTADLNQTVEQLQMEIIERLEVEANLQESEARFRGTFDQSPVGAVIVDLDLRFQQVNPAFCRIFGYTAEELSSMHVADVAHPDDLPKNLEASKRFLAGEIDRFHLVQRAIRKDGAVIWVDLSTSLIKDSSGQPSYFLAIIQDITAHKETDRVTRRQNAILDGINQIFREGLTCETEADLGRIAISVLEELTGAGIGLIYGLNPVGSLDPIALSDPGWAACKMMSDGDRDLPRHIPVRGLYRSIVQEGKSLLANQPASHPDSIGVPEGHAPLTEFLGVPLQHGDKVKGVICLANKSGGFTPADQEVAETLAIAIVEALIRFRAEQQAVNLGRLYRVLSKVNEAIVRAPDRETLFEQICRVAVEEGLFRMAWIGLVDREEGFVKAVAQYGLDEGYLERIKIPLGDGPESRGPTGIAVREGRYDVCNDFANDPRMAPWQEEALSRGYRSSGSFPLRVGPEVIGSLTMYAGEPGFFTSEEISLLESLAHDVSFAMESMDREAQRRQAEEALKESEEKLRYLASQLIGAQEAERKRISLELHDDLGQSLTFLKLQLRGIDQNLPADFGDLKERCANLRTNLDEVIEKVRLISRDLSPAMLIDLGFPVALRNLTEEFAKYHEIRLSLVMDNVQGQFSAEEEINLYRIFQEALNNIAKHAQATRIDIAIKKHKSRIAFSVSDNGVGFDVQRTLTSEAPKHGLGLATVQERVRMLGGTLKISSHEGRGSKISFAVPVRGQEQ